VRLIVRCERVYFIIISVPGYQPWIITNHPLTMGTTYMSFARHSESSCYKITANDTIHHTISLLDGMDMNCTVESTREFGTTFPSLRLELTRYT
jgi:hypothetical protein